MNVRPLFDRLLVERNDAPDKTKSGLYIPSSATDKPHEGKVLAVGDGHVNEDGSSRALQVKAGDTIVFGKYSGTEIKIENKDLLILRENEVLGIID
jgi:chaperonin GroES